VNKLHQAYIDLGLQPGSHLDDVLDRWRTVARMWHPDRAGSEHERLVAEVELKKINGARDLLAKHFSDGQHLSTGCECTISESTADQFGTNGPARRSSATSQDAERQTSSKSSRFAGAVWKAARRQPVGATITALITVAMLFVGWSVIQINHGIRIRRPVEVPPSETAYINSARMGSISSSDHDSLNSPFKVAIRPSRFGLGTTSQKPQVESSDKTQGPAKVERPKTPVAPKNNSVIGFVSSDGRLVSLEDGTTWELWPAEAADSFFQWENGDRITLKGLESSPSWLVNESRGFQAVKATPVR